jgi:major inositol transporter-like SP family MFS transporter
MESSQPLQASESQLPGAAKYKQFDALLDGDMPASKPASEEAEINYRFLGLACLVLGTSGLIFGYDIGVISGALPAITERFALAPIEAGLVVGLLAIGAMFGGLFGGYVCDAIGRRRTVHVQNALFALGTLVLAYAENVSALMAGRFVLGLGSGFSAVASLAYLCEVSPLHIRGLVTSAYEMLVVTGARLPLGGARCAHATASSCELTAGRTLSISFSLLRSLALPLSSPAGILVSWTADALLLRREAGWRFMFGGILAAVVAQTLGMLFMPESPRWLLAHGDRTGCLAALRRAYTTERAAESALARLDSERTAALVADVAEAKASGDGSKLVEDVHASGLPPAAQSAAERALGAYRAIAASLRLWKLSLALGLALGTCMHFSGGVMVRNYVAAIFAYAGVEAVLAGRFLIVLGVCKFGLTALAIALVDFGGRRPLLLCGVGSMAVGMALLTATFALPPLSSAALPLTGCVLVIGGYSLSYGPLVWLLWAELFPTEHRAEMIGLCSFVASGAMFLNNIWFEPLAHALGSLAPVFAAYTVSNLLAFCAFACFMPETKGALAADTRDELRQRLERFACCVRRREPHASVDKSTADKVSAHGPTPNVTPTPPSRF